MNIEDAGLFDRRLSASECEQGIHRRTIQHTARISDNSVEVDEVCLSCKQRVATVSYTRQAWEQKQVSEKKRRAGKTAAA